MSNPKDCVVTDTQSRIVEALILSVRFMRGEVDISERRIREVEAALAEARQQPPEGWVMVPREAVAKVKAASMAAPRAADILIEEALELFAAAPPQPAASEGPFGWVLITGQGEVFRRAKPDCLIDRWVPVWSAPQPAPPAGEPVAWMWNRGGVEFRTQPPPDYTAWQWTPLYTAQPDARDAVGLIAKERRRQIKAEGWAPEHDDKHVDGELVCAAAVYAAPDRHRPLVFHALWPWDGEWWKPTPNDRIRELEKAGALIVAEIERLQRIDAASAASKAQQGGGE